MELTQRYWLLELIIFWQGYVNTRPLINAFSISRQSASSIINKYIADFPHALIYNATQKSYQIGPHFTPHYINQSVDEYFDWLHFGKMPTFQKTSHSKQYRVEALARYVSPEIMRPLLKAVNEQTAVDCEYLSVSSSDPHGRLLYPHSFVKTANRWHVRAYCALRSEYLDFVLSRFQTVEYDGGSSEFTKEKDILWNTQVEILIAPDPRLSEKQKQVIDNDFGMKNGQLNVSTTAAMVKYLLDDL